MKNTQMIVALFMAMLLSSCGKIVPQDKLALVTKALGERTADASATAEIYWAKRLPAFASSSPSLKIYQFPLGIQDYSWTMVPSYESPKDEAFRIDSIGGQLVLEINIQLYVDHNDSELAKKLLAFIGDFQLGGYTGENDMLAKWAGDKLFAFIREPLLQYCLGKQPIDVMRNKVALNKLLLDAMNLRFNKYAIKFTTAGIISAVHPPEDQKKKMGEVVKKEYANKALEAKRTELIPLLSKINALEQEGIGKVQDEGNRASTESIRLVAEAQNRRRGKFISILGGPENYVIFEQMFTLSKDLPGNDGKTKITVLPSGLQYFGGLTTQNHP